jgi:acyl-CoA thioesterase I
MAGRGKVVEGAFMRTFGGFPGAPMARDLWFELRSYGALRVLVQGQAILTRLALVLVLACAVASAAAAAAEGPIRVVALGDSLTAGYGLAAAAAFPTRLEQALRARGAEVTIVNAGVSGDTTADGLARLDWSIPEGTEAVILELGANDALRGLDPQLARRSLETIIRRLKDRHTEVLLCGMLAPRNLGADYGRVYDAIFPDLASTYGLVFYPFFLAGVATDKGLNQADGLHPNAAGVDVIVSRITPKVEELLARVRAHRGS